MQNTPPLKTAVIADDESVGRVLMGSLVQATGLHTLTFDNGAEALQAARLAPDIGLVVLDVDMPGLDGYTVCRQLREEPSLTSVPIIMVTGNDDAEGIRKAFEAGATDFIAKPVNWALMPKRLDYILRNAAAAEKIERLAYFDPLTGLPNRQRCLDMAARLFEQAQAGNQAVAVLYMDLNGFKKINDTFGHAIGDEVLKEVSQRFQAILLEAAKRYPGLFVARFGGDEFVMLLPDAFPHVAAVDLAARCSKLLQQPVMHEGLEFFIAPSTGIAIFPEHGHDVSTVIKHADLAMYQAKMGAASTAVLYKPSMSARLRDWLELEGRLRRALANEQLHLVYQPKFNIFSNELVGVEALVRWTDPEHGEIPPSRFVPIAEESGLILELGNWVIQAVCRQLAQWLSRGFTVPVAVNVSGRQLLHSEPARVIESAARALHVPTHLIEVEITESILVKDSDTVQDALEQLRNLGCRIALDDFGTGYSSLAYITRFPPNRIKIDKAFVHNLDRSVSDAAIASAILSLGESLGVTITAEGIERAAQLEWLKRRGCHEVQGFLLSYPLAPAVLEERYAVSKSQLLLRTG